MNDNLNSTYDSDTNIKVLPIIELSDLPKVSQEKFEIQDKKEKMERYINNTKIKNADKYDMSYKEIMSLNRMNDSSGAIIMAFLYGRAKGYRAARKESK